MWRDGQTLRETQLEGGVWWCCECGGCAGDSDEEEEEEEEEEGRHVGVSYIEGGESQEGDSNHSTSEEEWRAAGRGGGGWIICRAASGRHA